MEDCKTQGDGAKDVDVANYYVEEGVKHQEVLEDLDKHEKFDNKQGMTLFMVMVCKEHTSIN